jgi:hypothetical protein
MRYVSKKDDQVTLEVPIDELRALLDIVNEALHGPYALTDDEWNTVAVHKPELREKILNSLAQFIDTFDSGEPKL